MMAPAIIMMSPIISGRSAVRIPIGAPPVVARFAMMARFAAVGRFAAAPIRALV